MVKEVFIVLEERVKIKMSKNLNSSKTCSGCLAYTEFKRRCTSRPTLHTVTTSTTRAHTQRTNIVFFSNRQPENKTESLLLIEYFWKFFDYQNTLQKRILPTQILKAVKM